MAQAPPPRLENGQRFADRYTIEGVIGRGGMGAVYRVRDEALGESVALKILALPDVAPELAVERFRREVRLARKVTHPNVARTHDFGEHDGLTFLTMELVVGGDLGSLLQREGALPLARAVEIARDIALGLHAAHEVGVIHRDLKPRNVMLASSGRVLLTDFGIARPMQATDGLKTEGLLGTPTYMSPEQLNDEVVEARSDIYSLGLVLFEMTTGGRPFPGDNPYTVALARLERDAPDPRVARPMPDELAELIMSCLARDPAKRPATAREAAERLSSIDPLSTPHVDAGATRPSSRNAMAKLASPESKRPLRAAPRLAVLPFAFRGPTEHAYLAESFTDELIDALCRTRGLVVLASGATASHRDTRDARHVGTALGVDCVIDGSVQAAGGRLRVSARLCDVTDGTQLASETCEGELADVFAFQDTMSRRIAEALRVSVSTTGSFAAPSEAIDSYLRGRSQLRAIELGGESGALALLERATRLAPEFSPAAAAYAIACVRAWFAPGVGSIEELSENARVATARAIEVSPELPEAHFAKALYALHVGDPGSVVSSLRVALSIAPAYAEAMESLGMIECEAGRPAKGVANIERAHSLDPTLVLGHITLARHFAVVGDDARFFELISTLDETRYAGHVAQLHLVVRHAAWRGDLDATRAVWARLPEGAGSPHRMLRVYAASALGEVSREELVSQLGAIMKLEQSPRFRGFMRQIAIEALAMAGAHEEALAHLGIAANDSLMDLEWLDGCPALDSLRDDPRFAMSHAQVLQRVDQLWSV